MTRYVSLGLSAIALLTVTAVAACSGANGLYI